MPVFKKSPELLVPFRMGRREALEEVYAFYVRGVGAYVHTLARNATTRGTLNPDLAADLIQDVFIRAFSPQARAAYDPKREYGPYLRTIARNCFIDALRSSRREVLSGETDWPQSLGPANETDSLLDPLVLDVLRGYLSDLPDSLRAVYEQRFMLGHSQEVACRALGLTRRSLRTCEARLKRGLKRALCVAGVHRHELALARPRHHLEGRQRHIVG